MSQKYNQGDLVEVMLGHPVVMWENDVHVQKDISPTLVGKIAVVKGSYKDIYGCGSDEMYELDIDGHGTMSWFAPSQLKPAENAKPDVKHLMFRVEQALEEFRDAYQKTLKEIESLKKEIEK